MDDDDDLASTKSYGSHPETVHTNLDYSGTDFVIGDSFVNSLT